MFRIIGRIAGIKKIAGESGATPLGEMAQLRDHAGRGEFFHSLVRRKC